MNHMDRYIYAVTKYLPEHEREEIARELRANIEDMLEGDHSEENMTRVLEEMGSPDELAKSYMGRDNYIIGPRVYYTYLEVLKVIAVVAVVIGVIIFAIEIFTYGDEIESLGGIIAVIIDGFGTIFSVLIGFVLSVTLIFIIIERTDSYDEIKDSLDKKFTVGTLKDVPDGNRRKISKIEMIITLVMTIVGLYIFLFRNELIAIYSSGEDPIRMFEPEVIDRYRVIVMTAGAFSIFVTIMKLIYGRWNELLGILSSVEALVSLGVVALILLNRSLINEEFIRFLDELSRDIGLNMLRFGTIQNGIIAVVSIITLLEIGTSLYYGFSKNEAKWMGKK